METFLPRPRAVESNSAGATSQPPSTLVSSEYSAGISLTSSRLLLPICLSHTSLTSDYNSGNEPGGYPHAYYQYADEHITVSCGGDSYLEFPLESGRACELIANKCIHRVALFSLTTSLSQTLVAPQALTEPFSHRMENSAQTSTTLLRATTLSRNAGMLKCSQVMQMQDGTQPTWHMLILPMLMLIDFTEDKRQTNL